MNIPNRYSKYFLILLLLLNTVVLLGQIWPEGAPPFAGIVNILFLSMSFIYFILLYRKR